MNREICLVVCFLLGMLIYHILKDFCGCDKVVEGLSCWLGIDDNCTNEMFKTDLGPKDKCDPDYKYHWQSCKSGTVCGGDSCITPDELASLTSKHSTWKIGSEWEKCPRACGVDGDCKQLRSGGLNCFGCKAPWKSTPNWQGDKSDGQVCLKKRSNSLKKAIPNVPTRLSRGKLYVGCWPPGSEGCTTDRPLD